MNKNDIMSNQPCIFCAIVQGVAPCTKIMEKDDLIVIQDIAPKAPVHYLVIPKKHVITLCDIQDDSLKISLLNTMQELAQKLERPCAFNVVMNNGKEAGQIVEHAHIHFLAGTKLQFLLGSQTATL